MSTATRPPRVRPDPRISRRRQAVARSRRRRFVTRAALLLLIGAVAWVALLSPAFDVRRVRVTGARHVTAAEIRRAAGLTRDDNLLLLSTGRVERAVRRLAWVKRVRASRRLPGTVQVRVRERRPAMVLAAGRARWTIDAHGFVLARGAVRKRLPELGAVQVANVRPGMHLETGEVAGATRAYRGLPRRVRREVVAAFAPSVERITFALRTGTSVRYGAPEQLPAKKRVLRALLARLAAEDTTPAYIDVRAPFDPAVSAAAAGP